ncbi:MAG: histidine phosphatase family protein [Candidatus Methylacidiphilales bacterium]
MKRLILIRHAKSSWDSPTLDDYDRPLNERGRIEAPAMASRIARKLNEWNASAPHMECSSARRAADTAECIASAINPSPPIQWNRNLYLCEPETWLDIIHQWPQHADYGISVGHNPGITHTVGLLSNTTIDTIPTAAFAVMEFTCTAWGELTWGQGHLILFDTPKQHLTM